MWYASFCQQREEAMRPLEPSLEHIKRVIEEHGHALNIAYRLVEEAIETRKERDYLQARLNDYIERDKRLLEKTLAGSPDHEPICLPDTANKSVDLPFFVR
jgi:hypothetical protein